MTVPKKFLGEPISLRLAGEDKAKKRNLLKIGANAYLYTKKAIDVESPELTVLQESAALVGGIISATDIAEIKKVTRTSVWIPGGADDSIEEDNTTEEPTQGAEETSEEDSE